MRGIRNLAWISLVAMLVMAMTGMGASSPDIFVSVEPLWSSAAPSETFDIYLVATDVMDLYLAEIFLQFDPGILEVVDDPGTSDIEGIDLSDQPNSLEIMYFEQLIYDSVTGWMEIRVVAGQPAGPDPVGLDGTVGIAKVTFHVLGTTSKSYLKLYGTWLKDTDGADMEVFARDGRFKNIYPTMWIQKKGAHGVGVWPDWQTGTGPTNTLYAKVVNTGEETARIRVRFKGMGPLGAIDEISNEADIAPGESATVQATMNVVPGSYDFYGSVEYNIEPGVPPPYPQWIPWKDVEPIFGGEGTSKLVGQGKFTVKG